MSGNNLPDIRDLSRKEIEEFFLQNGDKRFRAGQLHEWLWKRSCRSFDEMTSLSRETRQLLARHFTFHTAMPVTRQLSADGTGKTVFRMHDGKLVEGVMIPSGDRSTACISSQVGCSLGCRFCATGQLGFSRNLSAGEIVDQLTGMLHKSLPEDPTAAKNTMAGADLPASLSNIVFMGMGEPFLNYGNVSSAIERITAADGLGMSPQRITVSSVGIPRMIRTMANDGAKYHFALSLHAATDEKRDQIIPFNVKHPLADISDALKYYYGRTRKRFTIEYILFGGFNDSEQDARDLALFCRSFPVKVNLIEYNPVGGTGFTRSTPANTRAFAGFLEKRNMVVNVRLSRGQDIDAACGQLAGKGLPK